MAKRSYSTERHRKALELRKAGLSYSEIAERLGYAGHKASRYAVSAALKRLENDPKAKERRIELERLDRLLVAVWAAAVKGNEKAIDRALKIMQRRAKLLGLDPPARTAANRSPRKRRRESTPEPIEEQPKDDTDHVAEILTVLADAGVLPAPPEGTGQAVPE